MTISNYKRLPPEIRQALSSSELTIRDASKAFNVNPKTARKWKNRKIFEDKPKSIRRTQISIEFAHTLLKEQREHKLSIDKLLDRYKDSLPRISRSALYRALKRAALLEKAGNIQLSYERREIQRQFGLVNIRRCYTAFDPVTGVIFRREYRGRGTRKEALSFLEEVIHSFPYPIKTIETDGSDIFVGKSWSLHKTKRNDLFKRLARRNGIALTHRPPPYTL